MQPRSARVVAIDWLSGSHNGGATENRKVKLIYRLHYVNAIPVMNLKPPWTVTYFHEDSESKDSLGVVSEIPRDAHGTNHASSTHDWAAR